VLRQTKTTRGTFITDQGETEFVNAPIGWDNVEQVIARSKKTDGLVLNISQNQQFVKQEKQFLINEYYRQGAGGKVTRRFEEKVFNDYQVISQGDVNLMTLEWDKTTLSCDFVENQFDDKFKDNIREKFELNRLTDIDGNAIPALTVEQMVHKPRKIFLETKLNLEEPHSDSGSSVPEFITVPKVQIEYGSDTSIQSVLDSSVFSAAPTGDVSVSNAIILDSDRNKTITINWKQKVTSSAYDTAQLRMYRRS
jgi:hypothetical protein